MQGGAGGNPGRYDTDVVTYSYGAGGAGGDSVSAGESGQPGVIIFRYYTTDVPPNTVYKGALAWSNYYKGSLSDSALYKGSGTLHD